MDYKYIEQLLERYWQCETTLEEELILRTFFSQDDIPAHLKQYQGLFAYAKAAAGETTLGSDFDAKVLSMTEEREQEATAPAMTLRQRLMPLFKAAAVVAMIVTIGNAVQLPLQGGHDNGRDDINYANYSDTYTDPAMAYDQMHDALQLVSEGISSAVSADSVVAMQQGWVCDSTLAK